MNDIRRAYVFAATRARAQYWGEEEKRAGRIDIYVYITDIKHTDGMIFEGSRLVVIDPISNGAKATLERNVMKTPGVEVEYLLDAVA